MQDQDDFFDPEKDAFFTFSAISADIIQQLTIHMYELTVVTETGDPTNPFMSAGNAMYGDYKQTVAAVTRLLQRVLRANVLDVRKVTSVQHIVGPNPPNNDGLAITTRLRSAGAPGRICYYSVLQRTRVDEWVLFDNHLAD